MDFNKLTIKSQEAVGAAMEMARRRGNPEVYPEHLCLALLDQELPRTLVERAGMSVDSLRQECEARLSARPAVEGASQQPRASTALAELLDRAEEKMRELGDEYVSTEHILLALDHVPRDALMKALEEVRGSQRVTSQDPEGSYQALEKFGRDLTALAEEGKLDPVIGRDEEVRRVIQVLSRRTKNNPVLIGDPGVGKTAIVQGLGRSDHPLHRRAAHDRRRGRRGGRRRRGQHAQADARAGRAALRRCDDARRVPQAHREGRGTRASLPAHLRRRAVGR